MPKYSRTKMNQIFKTKLIINSHNDQLKILCRFTLLIFVITLNVHTCAGHGRLIEPPSRASAWRYGFNTPPDYNDHELYCGGFTRQWKRNGGKCGVCGDAWDMPEPRPHEQGGQWGQGIIVRRYPPGGEMTIRVELTASHMGYFEFKLCPEPNPKQDCLDRNLLTILGGSPSQPSPSDLEGRFYPRNGSRIYEMKALLPDITCNQCVLQWRYVAGNNWGICPDGNGAVGCGPQEEFRSCSDVALAESVPTPKRPIRPTLRRTGPKTPIISTESTQKEDSSEGFNYIPLLFIFILLLLCLGIFVIWYLYRKNNPMIIQCKEYMDQRLCRRKSINKTKTIVAQNRSTLPPFATVHTLGNSRKTGVVSQTSTDDVPIPPPRLKRQSRVKEMSSDESSVA